MAKPSWLSIFCLYNVCTFYICFLYFYICLLLLPYWSSVFWCLLVFAFVFDVLCLSSNNISHHAPPCHLEPDLKAAVWVEPGVIGMSDCTRQARTPYGIHACIWNLNCKICIFVFVIWSWFLLAVQSVSEFHFILSYQLAPLLTLITALRAFELQQTSLWQKSDPDKVFCRELNRKQADSPT